MLRIRDNVLIINKNLDLYGRQGKILMINKDFNNAYVIIDEIRYLIDLKDLDIIGGNEEK